MGSSSPKRRRPSSSRSDVPGGQNPRRKKKGSGKKKRKKAKSSGNLIAMIGIPVAVVALIACAVFFIDWSSIGQSVGLTDTPESLTKRGLSLRTQQVDLMKTIKNAASAKAAGLKYIELSKELATNSAKIADMNASKKFSPNEIMVVNKKYKDQFDVVIANMKTESARIKKNPGVSEIVDDFLSESRFVAGKIKNEAALERAKNGVNAPNYSPVTASTPLTKETRIEVLVNTMWHPGKITEIRDDGKVKVFAPHARGANGGGEYFDRSELRINTRPKRVMITKQPLGRFKPENVVYIRTEKTVSRAKWLSFIERMKQNVDSSMLKPGESAMVQNIPEISVGQAIGQVRIAPVSDFKKFADAIDFAKVVRTTDEGRKIVLSINK